MSRSGGTKSRRQDVGSLKGDLRELCREFKTSRAKMREMFGPVLLTLEHHTAELADIRGYLKDKIVTRDEFHSRMDGFTGRVRRTVSLTSGGCSR